MLVDDHQVMRDLLRDALENTGEFQVVAQAADGQEALRLVEEAAPDVIVMDVTCRLWTASRRAGRLQSCGPKPGS